MPGKTQQCSQLIWYTLKKKKIFVIGEYKDGEDPLDLYFLLLITHNEIVL